MNVYKYRFSLGDRVSRPTPLPTSPLLHQLPLAPEEEPWGQGKESSQTPPPGPSLGPGGMRLGGSWLPWRPRSLVGHLPCSPASFLCGPPPSVHIPCPPPPCFLSSLLCMACPPPPPQSLVSCRLPFSAAVSPAHSPWLPAFPRYSDQGPAGFCCESHPRRVDLPGLHPLPPLLRPLRLRLSFSHFPLLLLTPPFVWVDIDFLNSHIFLLFLAAFSGCSTLFSATDAGL